MATNFTKEELLIFPLLRFNQPNFKEHDEVFNSAMVFYYLVLNYRKTKDEEIKNRIIEHIQTFTYGGCEPQFDAHAFHSYVPTTSAIALVKHTPSLYDSLSDDIKHRLDVIMRAFAVLGMAFTSASNTPRYTLCMFHEWRKRYTANLLIPTYFAVLGAYYYAGSDEDFRYLVMRDKKADWGTVFDYDEFISELKTCGFRRALRTFTHEIPQVEVEGMTCATIRDFFETHEEKNLYGISMKGIPEFLGRTAGIVSHYIMKDHIKSSANSTGYFYAIENLTEINGEIRDNYPNGLYRYGNCYRDRIPAYLLQHIFNGGECRNEVECKYYPEWPKRNVTKPVYNDDGETFVAHTNASEKVNPSLGKEGMIAEFDCGARSDITYCYLDFAMATVIVSVCKELGYVDDGEVWANVIELYKNGSADLLYKDEVGYVGYNYWNQDYAPIEKKNCWYPFYCVACMIHEDNLK